MPLYANIGDWIPVTAGISVYTGVTTDQNEGCSECSRDISDW